MVHTEFERHDGCSQSDYSEEATLNIIVYATYCPENSCGASLRQLILQIGAIKYEVLLKNIKAKFMKNSCKCTHFFHNSCQYL